jgi:hypothetical protein
MTHFLPTARSPALVWTAAALFALSLPTLLLAVLDDRLFQGVSVWTKPWKFQVSIGLHLLTLALVSSWLPPGAGSPAARWYVVWVSIGSGLFELAYITWQAAWGQASHFNVATPMSGLMYSLMGVGAVLLTSTALVQGVLVLRSRGFALHPALQTGIGWGLVLTFVLGTGFGAYLSAQSGGHWVGGSNTDAGGWPIVGWARQGGDLRVAHFFGIHAVHVIALFAFLLVHLGKGRAPHRTRGAVWAFCAAYAAFSTWTFFQAVQGRPFLP